MEAGNAVRMKAGRSRQHDLLSAKYLQAFRGKKLHKHGVTVLLLRVRSYKQMLYLVGIEVLNS